MISFFKVNKWYGQYHALVDVSANEANLARVRAMDPARVSTFSYGSGTLKDWVLERRRESEVR